MRNTSKSVAQQEARRGPALLVMICLAGLGCLVAAFLARQETTSDVRARAGVDSPSGTAAAADFVSVELPPGTDVLDEVLATNAIPVPKARFDAGHVTLRKAADVKVTKTDRGFIIHMPSGAPVPTPTIDEGRLYVGGGFSSKEYYCFDARTGRLHWAVDLSDDGPSWAVASDDTIIFNTESCTIFALDAHTGRQRWSWYLGDPLLSSPTVAGGRVFAVYPVRGHGGASLSNAPAQETNTEAAIQADGQQPAAKAHHALVCFDLPTGQVLWQRWVDTDCLSAPVAVGEELYVATLSGTLYRFAQTDGRVLAARRLHATSAPVIAGGQMYFTRRADAGEVIMEAVAVQGSSLAGTDRVMLARAAPYLDRRIQCAAACAFEAGKFEASNGIMGGFGGGFGGSFGGGFGSGVPSVADPPVEQAAGDDAGAAPVGAEPPVPNGQAAGSFSMTGGFSMSATAPAGDLLSQTQQLAANVVGQGNVSTLQGYQGSRLLHWGERNFNCMGDRLVCSSAQTGAVLWSYHLKRDLVRLGGHLAAPPVAAGAELVLAMLSGQVLRIDPANGRIIETYEIGSPLRFSPVVENGWIYIGTQDGKVVCIDTGDSSLTGWATWGGDAARTAVR